MIADLRPDMLDPAVSLYLYALGGDEAYGRLRSEIYAPWEADAVAIQDRLKARLDRETRVLIANRIRSRGLPSVCLREVPKLPACPPGLDAGDDWEEGDKNRMALIKPVEGPARPLYVDWRLETLVAQTLKIGSGYAHAICMIYVRKDGSTFPSEEFSRVVQDSAEGIPAAEDWLSTFDPSVLGRTSGRGDGARHLARLDVPARGPHIGQVPH